MTTSVDIFHRAGVDVATDERARRAVKVFRALQPTLTAYARNLTKRQDVVVEMAARDNGSTDGKKIFYRPPIALGDETPHQRRLCDKRNELKEMLCPACCNREGVLVVIYHEIGHIAFESFAQVTEADAELTMRKAIEEVGTKYSKKIQAALDAAPARVKNSYIGISNFVSPFLPFLVNCLEDARVNAEMFKARPGTKVMFDSNTARIFREGVEQKNEWGQIITVKWADYPLNAQVTLGCFCIASGYDFTGWFAPQVEEALKDAELTKLVRSIDTVRSAAGVYHLAFPVLSRLRELGFCKSETDPEDEPEEQPQDEPQPEGESDDKSDTPGDAGDESELDDESGDSGDDEQQESSGSDDSGGDESDDTSESDSGPGDGDSEEDQEEAGEPRQSEPDDGPAAGDPEGADGSGGDEQDAGDEQPDASEESGQSGGSEGGADSDDDSEDPEGDSEGSGVGSVGESSPEEQSSDADGTPRDGGGSSGSDLGGTPDLSEDGVEDDELDETDLDAEGERGTGEISGPELESGTGGEQESRDGGDREEDGQADGAGDVAGGADDHPDEDESAGADERGDVREDSSDQPEDGEGDIGADLGGGTDEALGDDEPIDTGADEGEGGTEVIEDSSLDDIPLGTPEEVKIALIKLGDHEEKPTTAEEKAEEQAVDRAIIQGLYFETPSRRIYGVREHHHGSPIWIGGYNTSQAWDVNNSAYRSMGFRDDQMGRHGDFHAPEAILGPALVRMRVAFSENARGKNERNLKSGKINSRSLGKRAWNGDERLFRKRQLPGKRNYFVCIGLDVSGSTVGRNIVLEKRAAMAQATLCQRMGIQFAIYAHSGNLHDPSSGRSSGFDLDVYLVKEPNEPWDDKVQQRLLDLGPDSANLDGHFLEYLRKRCDSVQATDKIILYYSDGKMPAENHDEELEILQRELRVCAQKQYTVMGVGIRTDSPARHGLDTVQVDDDEDLVKVVRHLEKKLH